MQPWVEGPAKQNAPALPLPVFSAASAGNVFLSPAGPAVTGNGQLALDEVRNSLQAQIDSLTNDMRGVRTDVKHIHDEVAQQEQITAGRFGTLEQTLAALVASNTEIKTLLVESRKKAKTDDA
jgi:hypothetical protein